MYSEFIQYPKYIEYKFTLVLKIIEVNGRSMLPQLNPGDLLLTRTTNNLNRLDIAVFAINGVLVIKRVIGLPNEKVEICNNYTNINGKRLSNYFSIIPDNTSRCYSWVTNDDEYIIIGDNRKESIDSRKYGTVNKSQLKYKVILKLIPPRIIH